MNHHSTFVFIRPSRCFVAVAARWRRGGGRSRGGRACAAVVFNRVTRGRHQSMVLRRQSRSARARCANLSALMTTVVEAPMDE